MERERNGKREEIFESGRRKMRDVMKKGTEMSEGQRNRDEEKRK